MNLFILAPCQQLWANWRFTLLFIYPIPVCNNCILDAIYNLLMWFFSSRHIVFSRFRENLWVGIGCICQWLKDPPLLSHSFVLMVYLRRCTALSQFSYFYSRRLCCSHHVYIRTISCSDRLLVALLILKFKFLIVTYVYIRDLVPVLYLIINDKAFVD